MTDDFLLTAGGASFPLTAQLVESAEQLEFAALQAIQVIGEDVPMSALRPEEVAMLRKAVAAAHGAGRDIRLIASVVQRRGDQRSGHRRFS